MGIRMRKSKARDTGTATAPATTNVTRPADRVGCFALCSNRPASDVADAGTMTRPWLGV